MKEMKPEGAELNRTERRWLATHRELLDATIDELLTDATALSANTIAQRADRAAGTFFNHFDSVDAAVTEALQPVIDLRDGAADQLRGAAGDGERVIGLVLGSVLATIATANREFMAMAAARSAGYHLPGTGALSEAVIEVIGGPDSPNHVDFTTQMVAGAIDNAVIAYSEFRHPISRNDLVRTAWALLTTAVNPNDEAASWVDEAVEIATRQLDNAP